MAEPITAIIAAFSATMAAETAGAGAVSLR